MLALFEVLSFKGWLDVRDVLIKALGPVSLAVDDSMSPALVLFLMLYYVEKLFRNVISVMVEYFFNEI